MYRSIFIFVFLVLVQYVAGYRLPARTAIRTSCTWKNTLRRLPVINAVAEEGDKAESSNEDVEPTPAEIAAAAAAEIPEEDLKSKEIGRLLKKIESAQGELEEVRKEITSVTQRTSELDAEYGDEIARIKKEFNRMKERAFEEAQMAVDMAKADAVKDILPVTDNYLRAKSVFKTLETDNEKRIIETYDKVFDSLNHVFNDFGLTKVESVGHPFDFNFMEAITAQPSTEYKKDVVMIEYQVGYRMGERCVRPAMVVVSQGPGPSS